jgi:hypothetical protein
LGGNFSTTPLCCKFSPLFGTEFEVMIERACAWEIAAPVAARAAFHKRFEAACLLGSLLLSLRVISAIIISLVSSRCEQLCVQFVFIFTPELMHAFYLYYIKKKK